MHLFHKKFAHLMRPPRFGLPRIDLGQNEAQNSRLREVHAFGSNPGALRLLCHVPEGLSPGRSLVVVLHGCTQTAAGYDHGTGWSTLADRYGFALLMPQQQRANNPNGCFNWFQPGDIKRDQGEARSIREMIERMVIDHAIDRSRIFITGLSAGGAMTSVMLATYPDVFAGGAIIAGLPYGAAKNVPEALASMKQCPTRTPQAWGDIVRGASAHTGPWPRVSVWHGAADKTVTPSSASEIVKQWSDVHGLTSAEARTETVNGFHREVWRNATGDDVIESYSITRMAHGTPLATGNGADQGGVAGAFLLDVGISSTYHIAKFWGLSEDPHAHATAEAQFSTTRAAKPAPDYPPNKPGADGENVPGLATDVRAIITRALTAAGLMKSP